MPDYKAFCKPKLEKLMPRSVAWCFPYINPEIRTCWLEIVCAANTFLNPWCFSPIKIVFDKPANIGTLPDNLLAKEVYPKPKKKWKRKKTTKRKVKMMNFKGMVLKSPVMIGHTSVKAKTGKGSRIKPENKQTDEDKTRALLAESKRLRKKLINLSRTK